MRTVAFVLALSGCSWLVLRGPRVAPDNSRIECHDSYVAPAVDTALAVGFGALAVVRPSGTSAQDAPDFSALTALVIGIPGALLFGASAVTGYVTVSRCQSAAAAD